MKLVLATAFYVITMICPSLITAQQYGNICTPGDIIYLSGVHYKAIRVDSLFVLGGNDTLFVTYPTIREVGSTCLDTAGGSVSGRKIISRGDGLFLFFNHHNDTILINTQAGLNNFWTLIKLAGQNYLEGKITALLYDSVLGIMDSVKVISLQAKDSNGENISHPFNGKQFRLSRNYGFSRLFDLNSFPGDTMTYSIAGREAPELGVQVLTPRDIYNFDIGDEFHYTGYQLNNSQWVPQHHWKEIWNIQGIDSTGLPYTINYTIRKCKLLKTTDPFPGKVWYEYSENLETIIYQLFPSDPLFYAFPDEFLTFAGNAEAPLFYWEKSEYHQRQTIGKNLWGKTRHDSCWSGYTPITRYFEYSHGLGKTYETEKTTLFGYDQSEMKLVYYKKGNETDGTPVASGCEDWAPYLFTDKDTVWLLNSSGSSETLYIIANYTWEIHPSSPSWLLMTPTQGSGTGGVVFSTTSENQADTIRRFDITISTPLLDPAIVTIIQKTKPAAIGEMGVVTLTIYPNPTHGQVRINCNQTISKVELFDPLGILVKSLHIKDRSITLDLAGYDSGLWFFRIETGTGVFVRKIEID